MKTFKNKSFTARDYDCMNVVACEAETAPNDNYIECDPYELKTMTKLWKEGNVTYYGYL